jgi:hypothetical protein
MSPNAVVVVVRGGGWGCGVSANEYSYAHRAQINFGGDLSPYLTYDAENKIKVNLARLATTESHRFLSSSSEISSIISSVWFLITDLYSTLWLTATVHILLSVAGAVWYL